MVPIRPSILYQHCAQVLSGYAQCQATSSKAPSFPLQVMRAGAGVDNLAVPAMASFRQVVKLCGEASKSLPPVTWFSLPLNPAPSFSPGSHSLFGSLSRHSALPLQLSASGAGRAGSSGVQCSGRQRCGCGRVGALRGKALRGNWPVAVISGKNAVSA